MRYNKKIAMSKMDNLYKMYSKLFDAIEVVHKENVCIAQAIMALGTNANNIDEINKVCEKFEKFWDEAFKDVRKW